MSEEPKVFVHFDMHTEAPIEHVQAALRHCKALLDAGCTEAAWTYHIHPKGVKGTKPFTPDEIAFTMVDDSSMNSQHTEEFWLDAEGRLFGSEEPDFPAVL